MQRTEITSSRPGPQTARSIEVQRIQDPRGLPPTPGSPERSWGAHPRQKQAQPNFALPLQNLYQSHDLGGLRQPPPTPRSHVHIETKETTTNEGIVAPPMGNYKHKTDSCKNTHTAGTSNHRTARRRAKRPKRRPPKTSHTTTQCITHSHSHNHYLMLALSQHASISLTPTCIPGQTMDAYYLPTTRNEREGE